MPDDWRGVPLQVRTPSGGTIPVQIPPGMRAGDTFRIPVPDSDKDGLLDGEACCGTAARPEQVSNDDASLVA